MPFANVTMAAEVSGSLYFLKKSVALVGAGGIDLDGLLPVTNRMMSKSCTPQSRYIPPDTATYSGVGGSGSSVVERMVLIQPSSPLSTAALAAAIAAS